MFPNKTFLPFPPIPASGTATFLNLSKTDIADSKPLHVPHLRTWSEPYLVPPKMESLILIFAIALAVSVAASLL